MDDVSHHQTQADHFLALAESHARAGNFARSVDVLERAASHAAAAANSHWHIFARPTRRKLGRVLYVLAIDGHLSYTSAKSIHRFDDLYTSIDRACLAGNRPAAPSATPTAASPASSTPSTRPSPPTPTLSRHPRAG